MCREEIEKAKLFHKSFPQYCKTPLCSLTKMAQYLGLEKLYIKDESYRFELNAFKVLGGSYAIARYIAQKTGRSITELGYEKLLSEDVLNELGSLTFYTATDGNHGKGVAWAANKLGQKSVVLMPKGSTKTRLQSILDENADAWITEFNYDECVRMAAEAASKDPHGVMVQDTAWEGYEEIPTWIMQGYGTMALEVVEELEELAALPPTHVFVQAGVGSLAGAVAGMMHNLYPKNPPKIIVVEAEAAACLYQSAKLGDGSIRIVGGDMPTIMAGLACGEPNTISWDILKNHVEAFIALPDWIDARAMRMLAAPIKGDPPVCSGESGAAPFGALMSIMLMEEYSELKELLKLDQNSRVLLFSTEGDTDPQVYKSIVWEGKER